ncbi:MAG TPA: DUF2157 domain-containing protein [Mycobacteriales bacterium]|nr:DUF2157 domain-containing protein [Mycobacteriales bacterium]
MRDQEISANHAAWLRREVAGWQAEGLVDDVGAASILARYPVGQRASVVRLISVLGAAFVGVGLISLVASNIDEMSPSLRFGGIAFGWLAAVIVGELLARRDDADAQRGVDDRPSLAVGSARLVAVAAYGATIFQAAQSLQVPAYSSLLVGCWAAGALAYAYACRGAGPLVVGVATLVGWYAWAVGERSGTAAAVVAALLAAAVVTTAVAGVHDTGRLRPFAAPWSYAGAALALIGLFVAAIPQVGEDGLNLAPPHIGGFALAVVFAAGVASLGGTQVRREAVAALAILGAGLLLLSWTPADVDDDALSGGELTRALFATAIYLAAAVWFAVVGAVRDRPQLTNLATAALVVFVTMQSFGVFAPLLSGAALFLVLGIVLLAVGVLADRGRRRIVEEVA